MILTGNAPTAQATTLGLSDLTSPGSTADHFARWRYNVPSTTGAWTMKMEIMEGASVRATDTATGTGVTAGWIQRQYTLTAGEAGAITDYANLSVRFTATVAGAAQFCRPSADSSVGGWLTQAGGGTNLFQQIDETSASDSDYITTPTLTPGQSLTYVGTLSAGTNPTIDTDHAFRYRYRALEAGMDITVTLKMGATTIKEIVHTNAATSWTTNTVNLTTGEAAAISDYGTLTITVVGSYPTAVAPTVKQFGRATTDAANVNWAPSIGSDLFDCINETSASDADSIASTNTSAAYQSALTVLQDPVVHTEHVIRFRAKSAGSGDLLVILGSVSAGVIKSINTGAGAPGIPALTSSYQDYVITLSASEAAAITNYGDLVLQLNANATGVTVSWFEFSVPQPRQAQISWAEFQPPSAARAAISWMELETPDPTTKYVGDVPTRFAASRTKLYHFDTSGFTDITGAAWGAGSPIPAAPTFTSWGNDIIVTNRRDNVRYRAANTGNFVDLMTSTAKPKARFVAPVKVHLMLADISLSGDTFDSSDAIWWSAVNNARDFDRSAATQCGAAFVRDCPGQIMGLVGGSDALIFKRRSLHLITYTGGQIPFRQDVISAAHGTPFPRSIIQTPYGVLFFGGGAFYRVPAVPGAGYGYPEQIGSERIANYITDSEYSQGAILWEAHEQIALEDQAMVGWWDPAAGLAFWSYRSVPFDLDGVTVTPAQYRHQRVVTYNPVTGEWSTLPSETLDMSYGFQMPNTNTAEDHKTRGTLGLSWNGTSSTWFRFNGDSTYPARVGTKRQAIGLEAAEPQSPNYVRVTGVMPIYSITPQDAELPDIEITVRGSNDPLFEERADSLGTVVNPVEEVYSRESSADEYGWFPFDLSARWWTFQVEVPSMTSKQMPALKGVYVRWEALP